LIIGLYAQQDAEPKNKLWDMVRNLRNDQFKVHIFCFNIIKINIQKYTSNLSFTL
jgi:hypothetical protein